jgi:hypothetical protein
MCHARVETDAGDVEEQPLVYFARVNRPFPAAERQLERRRCVERNPKFTCQTITGSTWHERKRCLGERDRRGDLVHRAIAAPRNDRRNAASGGRARKLTRVAGTFGNEDV